MFVQTFCYLSSKNFFKGYAQFIEIGLKFSGFNRSICLNKGVTFAFFSSDEKRLSSMQALKSNVR